MTSVDLASVSLRELNSQLHALQADTNETLWQIANPGGKHAIACGLTLPITVEIDGHVGRQEAEQAREHAYRTFRRGRTASGGGQGRRRD